MTTSAALFRAANLRLLDYPFDAALASALALCDEAVVVVGQSHDDTLAWVRTLQMAHGTDRVTVLEREWEWDRTWQERVWNWASSATAAEWLMYMDADEALHEADIPAIRQLMQDPDVALIRFPYLHFFGTPRYVRTKDFYPRNTRLGRRSVGYRMRNWCSDEHPTHAVCQMVYGPNERNAHLSAAEGLVTVETPMYHYGWARSRRALAISQAKHRAWYADGGGLADGRLPDVPPYELQFDERLAAGELQRFDGEHPAVMARWFAEHEDEWEALHG